ncbi:hypothetical protein F8S09_15190 [Deinococcus sp. SDU3-2]|uniref:Uncharacterized protein n=2 Tax=Deinococcus terrestris TaxID=2651870 RepID=A0A7X1NY95_9DEIO|nr:hypothetical protein [Deinococcus terrestris]
MSVRRFALVGSLALITLPQAQATNCAFAPFGYVVKSADLVAQVEVRQHLPGQGREPQEMEVRVLKTYAGQPTSRTLRILGAGGLNPYPAIRKFPVGTRWVMALDKRTFQGQPLTGNVYVPHGCVQQGLLVSGSIAYGVLEGDPRFPSVATSISLGDLPAWVRARRGGTP